MTGVQRLLSIQRYAMLAGQPDPTSLDGDSAVGKKDTHSRLWREQGGGSLRRSGGSCVQSVCCFPPAAARQHAHVP